MKNKRSTLLALLLCMMLVFTGVACAEEEVAYDPYHIEQELAAANAALQLAYAPKVVTLENGVQVQRTPYDGSGFNTYVLNSDERGCAACHSDLAELVHNMP